MIRLTLADAVKATEGTLHAGDRYASEFTGMTHDTRRLRSGNLYCALPGERVDGHDFVGDAASAGAAAALVGRRVDAPLPQIEVDDVVRAMGRLAALWRRRLSPRVVAITGSNGKTTVKNMLATILERVGPTLATAGNYNNEIGVPLTLARLDETDRFAVVEMGCGQPGDIAYLADIAKPDVAIVTNAGPAHLERLGSVEGVARTKGELFERLDDDGTAIINADDEYSGYWEGLCTSARRIRFGVSAQADVRLEESDGVETVDTPAGTFALDLRLPGAHNRMNALAAAGAALALDVDVETIAAGLAAVAATPGRLETVETGGGWQLIDDTYNANPASLYAALNVLHERPGPRWLVLGDMAELGTESDKLHREIGRAARDLGVQRLFAIGPHAGSVADAFGVGAETFDDMESLVQRLAETLAPGVTCLVKGSRSSRMETVIERLKGEEVATC